MSQDEPDISVGSHHPWDSSQFWIAVLALLVSCGMSIYFWILTFSSDDSPKGSTISMAILGLIFAFGCGRYIRKVLRAKTAT